MKFGNKGVINVYYVNHDSSYDQFKRASMQNDDCRYFPMMLFD